jgi:cell wall-associated NlpC family hydrolase
MDVSKIISNSLLSEFGLEMSDVESNPEAFQRLLQSSLASGSLTQTSSCDCSSSSFDMLSTVYSVINQSKICDIEDDEEDDDINLTPIYYSSKANKTTTSTNVSSNMQEAIDLLYDQLGKPYVWGATGTESFDCSGLVQYIYKTALGKNLPRVSYEQFEVGQEIAKEDLQVGDLVFFDTMNKGRVSHVGMYVGNNEFIHAANSKQGVIKSTLTGTYEQKYLGARRP